MALTNSEMGKLIFALALPLRSTQEQFRKLATTQPQLTKMSAAIFLLAIRGGAQELLITSFLDSIVPTLLTQMNRTVNPVKVKSSGSIRGKIDWANTLKTRYGGNESQGTFICTRNQRQFDRLENQLLNYVLHSIEASITHILPEMAHWLTETPIHEITGGISKQNSSKPRAEICDESGDEAGDESRGKTEDAIAGQSATLSEAVSLGRYCYHQQVRVQEHIRNAYLANVSLPRQIHQGHLLAAQNTKSHLYMRVIEVYEEYHQLVAAPDSTHWKATLEQTLPLPPGAEGIQQQMRVLLSDTYGH